MNDELKNAYYAGLFDGEGSIFLGSNGANRPRKYPTICVAMTCQKTINSVKEYFEAGHLCDGKPHFPGTKPMYRWKATCKTATRIIRQIYPYLITKKENADIVLAVADIRLKPGPKPRPKNTPID